MKDDWCQYLPNIFVNLKVSSVCIHSIELGLRDKLRANIPIRTWFLPLEIKKPNAIALAFASAGIAL